MKKIHKNDFDGYIQYGSKKFYEKTGRKEHIKRLDKQLSFFKKKINNKKNQKFRSKCEVCGYKKNELIFIKNGFKHVRCIKCNFVFVNPTLKDEVFNTFFFNEDSYNKVLENKDNIRLDKLKFQYGLQKINNKNTKKKILDIGCAFGNFLDVAKQNGWDVYASEINKDAVKVLNKKKIPILKNPFKKNYYDAICMWLTFEHLTKPNLILKEIYPALKKKGKLLINVPNVDSLVALILKDKCTIFHGHTHVNHFSPETLSRILKKNKFKVQIMETIISDAGAVENYLNNDNLENPYLGNNKKKYSFTNPDYIHKNLHGYSILCIATK